MFITIHLSFSLLPGCGDLELLTVVVRQELCKVCICVFYRPPNSLSFVLNSFQSYLESLAIHQYTNFIALGDFNIDFHNPTTPLFSRLKSLCHLLSLTQIVKEPTHLIMMAPQVLSILFLCQTLYCLILALLFLLSLMQITRASMFKHLGNQQLNTTVITILRAKLFGTTARLTGRERVT